MILQALTISDTDACQTLDGMANYLDKTADSEEDGIRYMAYRRAALALRLLVLDMQQDIAFRVPQPAEDKRERPWYTVGRRAFGKAYGGESGGR